MIPFLRIATLLFPLLILAGCAGYAGKVRQARNAFERGDYETSAASLEKLAAESGTDQLLYLMDLGLVYLTAGRYEEAIKTFRKADELAEIKDYTSITTEAATVLLNDEVKSYKGEDFEKILINAYLAIAYTMSDKWEDALVECRRVNHKLDLMRSQGKLPYKQNAFAKYLAAVLFEAQREYNDAFVDYRQLASWGQPVPYLGAPLLRLARSLRANQEYEIYKKRFPNTTDYEIRRNEGEVVFLFEQGRAPVKVPNPSFRLAPMFRKQSYRSRYGEVRAGGKSVRTQVLFDIETTAIEQLEAKMAAIMAKKIGGIVVKELVAERVKKATDSEFLGLLASVILHATDRADLRSWTTLPATLQIARLTLPAGEHDISFDVVYDSGHAVKDAKTWPKVRVAAGKKVFLRYRAHD